MPWSEVQKVPFQSLDADRLSGPKPPKSEFGLHNVSNRDSRFRVLIVDRDEMSSDLLATRLATDGTLEASGIESADLLDCLSGGDVLLVVIGADLNHLSKTGFDLAQAVRRQHPTVPIVMILNQSTQDAVLSAFRSGARGVFSRQQRFADFLDCVEHVRRGCIWAGPMETAFLLEALISVPALNVLASVSSPLTMRELQVVKCAARGKTNKVIACELGLSEHTVKNYLFRAFEKLGVSNRVELLFYLTQGGHNLGPARSDLLPMPPN